MLTSKQADAHLGVRRAATTLALTCAVLASNLVWQLVAPMTAAALVLVTPRAIVLARGFFEAERRRSRRVHLRR